jgi:hypothetical protein
MVAEIKPAPRQLQAKKHLYGKSRVEYRLLVDSGEER